MQACPTKTRSIYSTRVRRQLTWAGGAFWLPLVPSAEGVFWAFCLGRRVSASPFDIEVARRVDCMWQELTKPANKAHTFARTFYYATTWAVGEL